MTTPTLSDEVTFISGLNADGTVAATAFPTWDANSSPATYGQRPSSVQKWGGATSGSAGGVVNYTFDPAWSDIEKAEFRYVLNFYSAVANISFNEVSSLSGGPGITFTKGNAGEAATTIVTNSASGAGTVGGTKVWTEKTANVVIDPSIAAFGPLTGNFSTNGGSPWTTLFHQIGLAVGLNAAGPYTGSNFYSQQYSPYDTTAYSVMSYIDPKNRTTSNGTAAYYDSYFLRGADWGSVSGVDRKPVTLMSLDFLALQRLYGLPVNSPLSGGQIFGFNTNISSTLPFYNFSINTNPVVTLWDMGGNNTLDVSGFSADSQIVLQPRSFSSVNGQVFNIAIADDTWIDTAICGPGNDTVICNPHGDTVTGYYGNDTIAGSVGMDTSVYSQARANYAVTRSGGTITVSGPDGTDTLTSVERLKFADQTVSTRVPGDFNEDGTADILWQNRDTGQVSIYLENGATQLSGSGPLSFNAGTDWHAVGTGDFNGDGKADILWQNANGQPSIWLMNGTTITDGQYVGGNPGKDWKVVATGDFNNDGRADILWQNTDGTLAVYYLNGSTVLDGSGRLPFNPGPDWKAIGTGDFNGDGKADILFQNANGQPSIWMMDGSGHVLDGSGYVGGNAGPEWKVIGAGDFDKDGKSDILWQNTGTGQLSIYFMDGATIRPGSGVFTGNAPAGWVTRGAEDMNGDGYSDILWQNTNTGEPSVYFMTGTTVLSGSGPFAGAPGASWQIIANSG